MGNGIRKYILINVQEGLYYYLNNNDTIANSRLFQKSVIYFAQNKIKTLFVYSC